MKGDCYTCGKLTVAASSGGSIKIVASTNNNEVSIVVCYKYTDMRGVAAGDVWVQGANCWGALGYSIGTPVLNSFLTINTAGVVIVNYKLATPVIQTNTIRGYVADQSTLNDDVLSTGRLKTPSIENTPVNGFVQTKNWNDGSTPGLLLHTTANIKSIGICCVSDYGGYGPHNALLRCYGGGSSNYMSI